MNNYWKTFITSFLILLAAVLVTGGPQKADATAPIVQHGATISKGCTSPKTPGDKTDCQIRVGYNDEAGDTISVDEAWDIQDFGLGHDNVRVPAVGNLPIVAVAGNTTCIVAGALPCKIGPAGSVLSGLPGTATNGSVTFGSNTYVIQANDPDPLPDQGNSNVHDLCDAAASIAQTNGCNTASNTLQFTSQTDLIHPHTTLTKTADPTSGRAPLDVTYTYNEKNDGDTAISGVVVTDDKCSPVVPKLKLDLIHNVGDTNNNGLLDPNETWEFTCGAKLTETTTNIATASGTVHANDQAAPKEEAKATVTIINPHTILTKTADPTIGRAPLDVIYTYSEKNDGNDPISNVVVTDDKCSPMKPTLGIDGVHNIGDTNNNGLLDPGETWVFTCKATLNETTTNIATASGTASDREPAPKEEARATVKVINPHTTLTKTADPKSGSAPLAVTYTYKETNDGNDPISNVVLTDDKCAPVTYQSGDTNTNNVLDPGETWTFTCKATLNETTTNTVVATGTASDRKPAPEEKAQATVEVVQGCTLTQGFWKNHPDAWKVNSLKLGTVTYTKAQLLDILKTPVKGNGLISLAHQLIAAKLNIASGASSSSIASTIASADALIGGKVVPPVGSGFLSPSSTSSLTGALDNYNSGLTGPGHCAD